MKRNQAGMKNQEAEFQTGEKISAKILRHKGSQRMEQKSTGRLEMPGTRIQTVQTQCTVIPSKETQALRIGKKLKEVTPDAPNSSLVAWNRKRGGNKRTGR